MGAEVVRLRAVVHGRVQMVGFRAFVIRHAGDAGLSGTVRNEPDGSVLKRLWPIRPQPTIAKPGFRWYSIAGDSSWL